MSEEEREVKHCYLVEHPTKGSKVFYSGSYYRTEAARLAVDYADNKVPVLKLVLIEDEDDLAQRQSLSAQFNEVARATVELPSIPMDALLSSVG